MAPSRTGGSVQTTTSTPRGGRIQCQLHQAEGENLERVTRARHTRKGEMSCLPFNMTLVLPCLREVPTACDTIVLSKGAKILMCHMLDHNILADGICNMESLEECVPSSLLQFVAMVERGADIKSQLRFGAPKTDLAMAPLLQYNCYARFKESVPTHRPRDTIPHLHWLVGVCKHQKEETC